MHHAAVSLCPAYAQALAATRVPAVVDRYRSLFTSSMVTGSVDEGEDAIGASAVALKRIGLMNAPDELDELCPSFPERGTLFGGQLRLRRPRQ